MSKITGSATTYSSAAWSAWGTALSAATPDSPFGWKGQYGQYRDSETGLIYCKARYYAPALGRFLSRDPIGFAGGTNLYAYCGDDPIDKVDPSGTEWYGPTPTPAQSVSLFRMLGREMYSHVLTPLGHAAKAAFHIWERAKLSEANYGSIDPTCHSSIPHEFDGGDQPFWGGYGDSYGVGGGGGGGVDPVENAENSAKVEEETQARGYAGSGMFSPGGGNGIMWEVGGDGMLSHAVDKTGTGMKGYQLFDHMMNAVGGPGAINGFNCSFRRDNLDIINQRTGAGMSLEQALNHTSTGRWAGPLGFTNWDITPDPVGSPGNYTSVWAQLTRP